MNLLTPTRLALLLFALLLPPSTQGCALPQPPPQREKNWEPWPHRSSTKQAQREEIEIESLATMAIAGYQTFLRRPEEGQPCPMVPSCSVFTMDAIRRFGLIPGVLLGVDRLFVREGSRNNRGYVMHLDTQGRLRFFDPTPELQP